MSVQKPIVVVGSINTDLVAVAQHIPAVGETVIGTDFQIHPGGKGANQAVAVARLGYPVRLIGRLGSDAFGAQLRTHLESAGVDVTGVATSEGTSGVAVIVLSSEGDNSIVVTPGANAQVTPEDIAKNAEMIRSAGIVLAQLEIPLETIEFLAALCAREGIPLILDPAPAQELPANVFRNVAWFTPNQIEAGFFTGIDGASANGDAPARMAEAILARGCGAALLKLGSHGAYLASRTHAGTFVPAFTVRAVDTTAAGDAFNGGFATGLMLGKSPVESATFAAAVAAVSVTRAGAQPSMPSMDEAQDLLARGLALRSGQH
ncbi:MAG TPA: ribokinase [Terracidiphilus sp.]|nr:ribokinase [Terracidiphilus sp.]